MKLWKSSGTFKKWRMEQSSRKQSRRSCYNCYCREFLNSSGTGARIQGPALSAVSDLETINIFCFLCKSCIHLLETKKNQDERWKRILSVYNQQG